MMARITGTGERADTSMSYERHVNTTQTHTESAHATSWGHDV